jgi:hypothetical protein
MKFKSGHNLKLKVKFYCFNDLNQIKGGIYDFDLRSTFINKMLGKSLKLAFKRIFSGYMQA